MMMVVCHLCLLSLRASHARLCRPCHRSKCTVTGACRQCRPPMGTLQVSRLTGRVSRRHRDEDDDPTGRATRVRIRTRRRWLRLSPTTLLLRTMCLCRRSDEGRIRTHPHRRLRRGLSRHLGRLSRHRMHHNRRRRRGLLCHRKWVSKRRPSRSLPGRTRATTLWASRGGQWCSVSVGNFSPGAWTVA